ncbi:MAG: polyamine aminopropyltransferase [Beduini sp.]|uniref:polyamine aminopropyltransferase n=1 Tax=Beduini sp. TaxID=1922300 RepID=UPI0011CBCE7B
MELWYSEKHTDNVKLSIRVDEHLYSKQSEFQRIDILKTYEFGKILTLDGVVMLTEKDEFIYHEMITHVPMAVNPKIKKVLVIGAGDGGTVNQLIRYSSIEKIDVVEIDRLVVEACRQYFSIAKSFDDPRVTVFYEDGLKFVRTVNNEYDLIIVDSTDPFGPGEGLFTKEFYGNCYKALKDNGILINQHESPYYSEDALAMMRAHRKIASTFEVAKVYQAHIPSYPSGHWLFGFASKGYNPQTDVSAWNKLNIKTKYYNTELHDGCFKLPNYVLDMLEKH